MVGARLPLLTRTVISLEPLNAGEALSVAMTWMVKLILVVADMSELRVTTPVSLFI